MIDSKESFKMTSSIQPLENKLATCTTTFHPPRTASSVLAMSIWDGHDIFTTFCRTHSRSRFIIYRIKPRFFVPNQSKGSVLSLVMSESKHPHLLLLLPCQHRRLLLLPLNAPDVPETTKRDERRNGDHVPVISA
jgi:hypothetical protein